MKKVTGIGGVFFKCKDPDTTKNWYEENLGIISNQYGSQFHWRDEENQEKRCTTAWSPMPNDTDYYAPSKSDFMINYRVENLDALLVELKKSGVKLIGEPETFEYGKFAWVIDPDGRKVELWEPIDESIL